MRLSSAVEGYLLAKRAEGYSPYTLSDYALHYRRLVAFLSDPELGAVSADDLRRYLVHLREERRRPDGRPLATSTLRNAWCALRSLFRWAHAELDNPRPDLTLARPRVSSPQTQPFSEAEVRRLLKAAEFSAVAKTERRAAFAMRRPTARRDVALILLLLDTGLRASECARLTVGDVDQETGAVAVRPWRSGLKSRPRVVYLGARARRALWRYLATRGVLRASDPLFTARDAPMTRDNIGGVLARLGARTGVTPCHPHRFRHTMALQFLRNGGDVLTLQRMLGHSTLDMVRRYVALAESDMAEAHRRASPADNWRLRPRGGRGR
jgi:integrase/recombinase XerD